MFFVMRREQNKIIEYIFIKKSYVTFSDQGIKLKYVKIIRIDLKRNYWEITTISLLEIGQKMS